jgi:phage-related minor tail protein
LSSNPPLEGFIVSLSQTIEAWFAEAQAVAQLVAPIAAFLGFIGLGVMYMGSSWPIIGQWKQDNPRAANHVVMGLVFVIAASTVASLISFAQKRSALRPQQSGS